MIRMTLPADGLVVSRLSIPGLVSPYSSKCLGDTPLDGAVAILHEFLGGAMGGSDFCQFPACSTGRDCKVGTARTHFGYGRDSR